MRIEDAEPDMRVVWAYEPRGGYGYVTYVWATVKRVGPKRVTIEAPLATGGTKLVQVSPARLSSAQASQPPGGGPC